MLLNLRAVRREHRKPVPRLGQFQFLGRSSGIEVGEEKSVAIVQGSIIGILRKRQAIGFRRFFWRFGRRLSVQHHPKQLLRMVQLVGEGRPLQPLQHFLGKTRMVISGERQKAFAFGFRRSLVFRHRVSSDLGSDGRIDGSREKIVPQRSQVHALKDKIVA